MMTEAHNGMVWLALMVGAMLLGFGLSPLIFGRGASKTETSDCAMILAAAILISAAVMGSRP